MDQLDYRIGVIEKELELNDIDKSLIKIVVGRGGLIKPLQSGVYKVNDLMKRDLRIGVLGQHANNLGGLIADKIAGDIKVPKHS